MRRKSKNTEADEVDEWYDILMRGTPMPGDDRYELKCNEILERIITLRESGIGKNVVKSMMLTDQLRTAVITMIHRGRNPATVPYRHIRHALDHPIQEFGADTPAGQRATIKGPTRAIRVFCTKCMGGQPTLVANCSAINCYLWPFRMGNNPFYGRIADSDAEAESNETDEEIEAMEAENAAMQAARLAIIKENNDGNS